jgi:hypothetical protein
MLSADLSLERRRTILRLSVTGLIPYAIATVLAIVSPYVMLLICAGVAAFYALPLAAGGKE